MVSIAIIIYSFYYLYNNFNIHLFSLASADTFELKRKCSALATYFTTESSESNFEMKKQTNKRLKERRK